MACREATDSIVSTVSFFHYSLKRETGDHEPCCSSRDRSPSGYLLLCFGGLGVPPTQFHWLTAGPAACSFSILPFSPFLLCFSNWLTESCCGCIVRLELHIADEKMKCTDGQKKQQRENLHKVHHTWWMKGTGNLSNK